MPVTSEILIAKVIDQDQDDVGVFDYRLLSRSRKRETGYQQKGDTPCKQTIPRIHTTYFRFITV
jgi:hypothetical protein